MANKEIIAISVVENDIFVYSKRSITATAWLKDNLRESSLEVIKTTDPDWIQVCGSKSNKIAKEVATYIIKSLLLLGWKQTQLNKYKDCMWFEKETLPISQNTSDPV